MHPVNHSSHTGRFFCGEPAPQPNGCCPASPLKRGSLSHHATRPRKKSVFLRHRQIFPACLSQAKKEPRHADRSSSKKAGMSRDVSGVIAYPRKDCWNRRQHRAGRFDVKNFMTDPALVQPSGIGRRYTRNSDTSATFRRQFFACSDRQHRLLPSLVAFGRVTCQTQSLTGLPEARIPFPSSSRVRLGT